MGGSAYVMGRSAEFDLRTKLEINDFVVMRAYASKGPFDLMAAVKGFRPLLLEVKYYKTVNEKVIKMLKKKSNTNKLMQFAELIDAYPLLAFKIRRKGYLFYRLDINKEWLVPYRKFSKIKDVLLIAPYFT